MIKRAQLVEVCRVLGLVPEDVRAIHISTHRVEVITYVRKKGMVQLADPNRSDSILTASTLHEVEG